MHDVIVYGASGYTGRLICAELQRRKVDFAVAGRDEAKLRALAAAVGEPAVILAGLDDPPALERMAAAARVVLDCAGPFARLGRAVQDAALAARRHFLDITGEQLYMRATFARDAEARARDVALINAVGFDVVPTDAAAALAAEAAGAPVSSVRIAFAAGGARPSQGTTRSALEAMGLGSVAWVDGEWRREPVGAETWEVNFPAPIGARACVSLPWGDVATAPRSTGARNVRTFIAVGRHAGAARLGMRLVSRVAKLPPVRALSERWLRTLPEGPSDASRARSSSAVWAEATGARGTRSVWVTCGNGYDFTAASAALCAELAARPEFAARGAPTPAQAFGARALLDGLAASGVRWGEA
jgi:saccharopine dehydrogenase (NAD+, L-lysine-forming)